MEEYYTSHNLSFDDSIVGICTPGSGFNKPVQMVINEYSISPAEDYFNGFVLGVNKGCPWNTID